MTDAAWNIYTLADEMGKRVLSFESAYLGKIVDTVNDLDNILSKVCKEAAAYSTAWQFAVIRFVHEYEATKSKQQHPVAMPREQPGGLNRELLNSPADWVSTNNGSAPAADLDNPSANFSGKVIVTDTHDLCGHSCGDNVWVWKSFNRGLNVLFIEELTPSPTWHHSARVAMGQARRFAERIHLTEMTPHEDLASTQHCRARPGFEYVVFQPGSRGEFTVNLSDAHGPFRVEWFEVNTGETTAGDPLEGGDRRIFRTPFPGSAVLYLKRAWRTQ